MADDAYATKVRAGFRGHSVVVYISMAARLFPETEIMIENKSWPGEFCKATSIMGLMMLAFGPGSDLEVKAKGPDAEVAAISIAKMLSSSEADLRLVLQEIRDNRKPL